MSSGSLHSSSPPVRNYGVLLSNIFSHFASIIERSAVCNIENFGVSSLKNSKSSPSESKRKRICGVRVAVLPKSRSHKEFWGSGLAPSQATRSDSRFTRLGENDRLASALSLSLSSPRPCAPGLPGGRFWFRGVMCPRGAQTGWGGIPVPPRVRVCPYVAQIPRLRN